MSEVTRLLQAVSDGDAGASAALLPAVYEELRRLARAKMAGERAGHTLEATALVHEAYVRLEGSNAEQRADGDAPGGRWDGAPHFFAAAAEAMRRILVEHARRRSAIRHGGGYQRVALDDDLPAAIAAPCDSVTDLVALDAALARLASEDPDHATLVKLLFFTGLSLDEAAAALGLSRSTAYRRWLFARAWLHDAMSGTQDEPGDTSPDNRR